MPRNSSGTYSLPSGNPVVSNTLIQSTWANTTMSDLGSSITDSLDRSGRGAMLAPLKNTDGTQVAPAMTFSSEGTLGLYRVSAGILGFAVGGALVLSLSATGLIYTTPLIIPQGTAAAPALTFVGNTNTGIYSPGTSQVSISTAGVDRLAVNATGAVTLSTGSLVLAAAGANSITASNAVGTLLFQTGGAFTRMTIDAAGNQGVNSAISAWVGTQDVLEMKGLALTTTNTGVPQGFVWSNGIQGSGIVTAKVAGWVQRLIMQANTGNWFWQTSNATVATGGTATMVSMLTLDPSGNVGIGTTVPAAPLEVMGNFIARDSKAASANSTGRFFGGAFTGNPLTAILTSGTTGSNTVTVGGGTAQGEPATQVLFVTGTPGALGNGLERVRIDAAGNVGIGVVPSSLIATGRALQIISGGATVFGAPTLALYTQNLNFDASGNPLYQTTAAAMIYRQTAGVHSWQTAPSGTAGTAATMTTYMSLSAAGALTTGGNLIVGGAQMVMGALGTNAVIAVNGTNDAYLRGTTINLQNVAGSSTWLSISSAGNVVIGGSGTLSVPGSVSTSQGFIVGNSGALDALHINSTSGFVSFYNTAGTTLVGQVFNNGDASLMLRASGTATAAVTTAGGGLTVSAAGVLTDATANELGWRDIPINTQTGPYTLVQSDRGKQIQCGTSGVTVPSSTFPSGSVITIYNNSATSQTITQGASVTMYFSATGGTGNRTLSARGLCTVLCLASNTFAITGAGLS